MALRPGQNTEENGEFRLPLPPGTRLCDNQGISLRASLSGNITVRVRWNMYADDGRLLFVGRNQIDPGTNRTRIDQPFTDFRWSFVNVGDWCEVRTIGLQTDQGRNFDEILVDDIGLIPGARASASAWPSENWYRSTIFGNVPHTWVAEGTFYLGIAGGVNDAGMNQVLNRIRPIATWLRTLFDGVTAPVGDPSLAPVVVALLPDRETWNATIDRLGDAWGVGIASPRGTGYTVQEVAMTTTASTVGIDRPNVVHEAVHGFIPRVLRISGSDDDNRWLHEGLADYIDTAVHPDMVNPARFTAGFMQSAVSRGRFPDPEQIFENPFSISDYPMLTSVVAYLIENDIPLPARLCPRAQPKPDGTTGLGRPRVFI